MSVTAERKLCIGELTARARCALQERNWDLARRLWTAVLSDGLHTAEAYAGAVNACLGAARRGAEGAHGDTLLTEAASLLAEARHRGFGDAEVGQSELDIAQARCDWPALLNGARTLLEGGALPPAPLHLAAARALWNMGHAKAADTEAEAAIEIDPTLTDAVLVRLWAATDRGDSEAALAHTRRLVKLNPSVLRWSLQVVKLLSWLGRGEEARAEIQALHSRHPNDPNVLKFLTAYGPPPLPAADTAGEPDPGSDRTMQAIVKRAPHISARKRGLVAEDTHSDFLLAQVDGAVDGLLLFTGSNGGMGMRVPFFDLFIAPLNATAIYLRDFNRLRYIDGIRSFGDYGATLAALRRRIDEQGIRNLFVIGNCDGGFAAIRYGKELGARTILAFGAPTHIPANTVERLEQGRNFLTRRLASQAPAHMTDLRLFLESRSDGANIQLFYFEDDTRDRMHAQHLAGLPGVTLRPWPGMSAHGLLPRIACDVPDFSAAVQAWLSLEYT